MAFHKAACSTCKGRSAIDPIACLSGVGGEVGCLRDSRDYARGMEVESTMGARKCPGVED